MSAAKKKTSDEKDEQRPSGPLPPPRLRNRYDQEVLPALSKSLGRKNLLSLPKVKKVVVNMGVGAAITEKKYLEEAVSAITQITGQKPLITRSRVAVSGFRLRENMDIGCKVTLRGTRMWEFLDRLISLALPRVRDFRGLNPNAFDGHGNYSLGLSEQLVFPELNPDKYTRVQGMNVTIVTSTSSNDEARELLRAMGLPFKVEEEKQAKAGVAS
ncbi:MAG TPA: 50S ribosomal protein L5 [Pirellulales bacterium]|jgi:large subunit ribosomal protein L5